MRGPGSTAVPAPVGLKGWNNKTSRSRMKSPFFLSLTSWVIFDRSASSA